MTDQEFKNSNLDPSFAASLLDSLEEGICSVDLKGRIIYVNKATVHLFGYSSPQQLVGQSFHTLLHPILLDTEASSKEEKEKGCPLCRRMESSASQPLFRAALRHVDGTQIHIDCRSVVRCEGSEVLGFTWSFVNPTKSLERGEKRDTTELAGPLGQMPMALCIIEPSQGTINYANQQLISLVGKPVIGESIFGHFAGEVQNQLVTTIEEVCNYGEPKNLNEVSLRPIKTDKRSKQGPLVNVRCQPYIASGTTIDAIVISLDDVTEQVEKRQLTEASVKKFVDEKNNLQSIFQEAQIGMALLRGPNFVFEKVNQNFRDLVGKRKYLGRTWYDVYPDVAKSALLKQMTHVFYEGEPFQALEVPIAVEVAPGEKELRYFDYKYTQILGTDGDPYGILIQSVNVTEKTKSKYELQESQKKLRLSEEQLLAVIEVAQIGYFDWDIVSDTIALNQHFENLFRAASGVNLADLLKVLHPEDRDRVRNQIEVSIQNNDQCFHVSSEYRLQFPNEESIWIRSKGQVFFDDQEKTAPLYRRHQRYYKGKAVRANP